MKNSKLMIILFFVLIFPLVAQEDLQRKAGQYIEWMNNGSSQQVWTAASRLEDLGKKVIPILKREIRVRPEIAQVACAKVLINLGEIDYGLEVMLGVVENGKDPVAKRNAISLIGIYGDFELEDRLNQILESTFDPELKIALAKTLWQVARDPEAARVLKGFLEVENAEIQYQAALALAETNNVEAAKPILSRLKDEPTLRGRLARSFLEQDTVVNRYERLLDSQSKVRDVQAKSKYAIIDEVIDKIKRYHVRGNEFGTDELINSAIKGMVLHCDAHSAFWTEDEWKDFVAHIVDEEYVGIGVYVGERDGFFTVIAPIYSGPAYQAGVRSLDRIVEVNGWPTTGKSIDDIVNKIRGDHGSVVKLKIARDGWAKEREIEVPRKKIQIPSIFYAMLPGKIGYLRLTQFGRKATMNMENALKEMESEGMKGFVLDLRGNGGGWLKTAVDIVDKFIGGRKLIVYSKGRHPIKGRKYSYYSTEANTHPDYPIAVLVNGSSASASEIVAGTLQYYKRATIVGSRSFGKGSVQEPLEIDSRPGARLKLTIARYFLPDGRCIHNVIDKSGRVIKRNGIVPDLPVKPENWEVWKNEELTKLEEQNKFKDYLESHYNKDKVLFQNLADNDNLDSSKYPDFDKWYRTLKTKASVDDVRGWLRMRIRRKIADERGQEYACDYMEDVTLQQAILEIFKKLQIDPKSITEYKSFLK